MPQYPPRPRREDIPEDVKPADILHELRVMRWELNGWHKESHLRFDTIWTWLSGIARLLLLSIPVALAALLALHLGGALPT